MTIYTSSEPRKGSVLQFDRRAKLMGAAPNCKLIVTYYSQCSKHVLLLHDGNIHDGMTVKEEISTLVHSFKTRLSLAKPFM